VEGLLESMFEPGWKLATPRIAIRGGGGGGGGTSRAPHTNTQGPISRWRRRRPMPRYSPPDDVKGKKKGLCRKRGLGACAPEKLGPGGRRRLSENGLNIEGLD
jgi:hypothetical protein